MNDGRRAFSYFIIIITIIFLLSFLAFYFLALKKHCFEAVMSRDYLGNGVNDREILETAVKKPLEIS